MRNYEVGKSILQNLIDMSEQRACEDVAKECDIVFCRGDDQLKKVEGLPATSSNDPLKAALNYALANDKTCLVIEHSWFCVVPSKKSNLCGWLNRLKLWDSIDESRRINELANLRK